MKHFDGRRFFNPTGANGRSFWAVPRMLRTPRTPWPAHVPVTPRQPPPLGGADVTVTFVGHSTFLLQTRAGNVLTDPIYAERASPVSFAGPRRVRAPGVRLDDLPEIAVVLLSHNHYDHCDLRTLAALDRRFRPLVVTPLGNGRLLRSAGLRHIEELDWWQDAAATPFAMTAVPAQHFSARGPFDRNRALWSGFVCTFGDRVIYFAGDTGYGPHFHDVGTRWPRIDLALLPIGAYEPRWFMRDIHMDPAEAVQAHLDIGARQSIGMHFGTFQLTTEGIDAPIEELARVREQHDIPASTFHVLANGESMVLQRNEGTDTP